MIRRTFLTGCGAILGASAIHAAASAQAASEGPMDALTCINTRRSVRSYKDTPITDEEIHKILSAAMMAPSAVNEQPWEFVVINNRELLEKAAQASPYAHFAAKAPLAILLCLNKEREKEPGMSVLDMGMCAENLMLAAHALGIGSVFTGIYPIKERMEPFAKLCELPPSIAPMGMIVLGRPAIDGLREAPDRFRADAIHINTWNGK